jgi:hypothetical protein
LRTPRAAPALLVLVAALWVVPNAGADFTSSHVNTPTDPTFSIYEPEAPSTITVTGTAAGGVFGEELALRCYYGASTSRLIDPGLTPALDGTFSATIVPETSTSCRLRAVTAGTEPTELAPFTGPVLAVGESRTIFTTGGVNEGMPFDFYANGQQLTAADDYVSIGECGLADSYLRNAEFEELPTFFCNDFYDFRNNSGHPAEAGFRVDGTNAYFSENAFQINQEADGFPQLTYSHSQNPSNGDLTIADGESPAICPDPTYPPTAASCEEFLPSGVRDERTIEQTHDGHLVVITDTFHSTDGKTHAIEALPENEQNFNQHGEEIEYKFPGESGYAPRVEGESVSFPDAGEGAVYIRVTGSADGDTETGRGAIVLFQPSSPAYFDEFRPSRNGFYFDNVATVPAAGTTTIKYAYAQAYGQAEVEALVADATAQPTPEAPPPTPAPVPVVQPATPPAAPSPAAEFRIRQVHHFKATGTLKMRIAVTGPGQLSLTGKRVSAVSRRITEPGTLFLTVGPTLELRSLLERRGVVHVTVNVEFAPDQGSKQVKVKQMHLVLTG